MLSKILCNKESIIAIYNGHQTRILGNKLAGTLRHLIEFVMIDLRQKYTIGYRKEQTCQFTFTYIVPDY